MDYQKYMIQLFNESIVLKVLMVMMLSILFLRIYKKKHETFKNSNQIEIYDQLSDSFKMNYEISQLSKYIPLQSRILDMECSTGQYVHQLSIQGYQVEGIDSHQKNIEYCLKKYSYPFKQSTTSYLPQTFDVILCMNLSIYKHKHIENIMQKIYDWLKSGGYVYIYCVDDLKPLFKKKYNLHRIQKYDPKLTQISKVEYSLKEYVDYDHETYYYETPLYFYSKEELMMIAKQYGFIIQSMIQLNKNESIYQLKKPN
jgi:2-polyprenyl-3-methyl-5-hydroxy-6-metoxy-1,4-benzoquinol methylase